jgi:hypothetical protein
MGANAGILSPLPGRPVPTGRLFEQQKKARRLTPRRWIIDTIFKNLGPNNELFVTLGQHSHRIRTAITSTTTTTTPLPRGHT